MGNNRKLTTWLNGYYNYTVVLTYTGMLIGFFGILNAFNEHYDAALICLMLAGFCDMFDGAVASTKERDEQEKKFGIQIDSLSDLICFGVFPAMFVSLICEGSRFSILCSGVYVLCALIRLAYFNVCEEERQKEETSSRKYYEGLPVTSAALLLPACYLLEGVIPSPTMQSFSFLLLAMAIAFILPFRLPKPHLAGKLVMVVTGAVLFGLLITGLGASV